MADQQEKLIDELVKAASEWLDQTIDARGPMNGPETQLANAIEDVRLEHDKYKTIVQVKSGSSIIDNKTGTTFKILTVTSIEKYKDDVFIHVRGAWDDEPRLQVTECFNLHSDRLAFS